VIFVVEYRQQRRKHHRLRCLRGPPRIVDRAID
jgi:hypothetical protein